MAEPNMHFWCVCENTAGKYTPQYKWLLAALRRVDRNVTPWLIVLMHTPLYNSNSDHYYEGEPMRVIFEQFLVEYKVDVVFAGHVHAYERTVSTRSPCLQQHSSVTFHFNYAAMFNSWLCPFVLLQHPVSNVQYDIVNGQCNPLVAESSPVYIVIGDGGNIEGLSAE